MIETKNMAVKVKLVLLLLFISLSSYSQNKNHKEDIKNIIAALNQKQEHETREGVYLQLDKPYYVSGDTLWYKAYVLNATSLNKSEVSGMLYLDIADENNQSIKRFIVPVKDGLGYGYLPLVSEEFATGSYVLRAYTNWMRNYEEDAQFNHQFYITSRTEDIWRINARANPNKTTDSVLLNVHLQDLYNQPIVLQDLKLKVSKAGKTIIDNNVKTGVDGSVNIGFPTPAKPYGKQVLLSLTENTKKEKRQHIVIPLQVNSLADIDIQFMPESGSLVAGLNTIVGFKAINENGAGVNVSGEVLDHANRVVTTFNTQYKGMGKFMFSPHEGETYVARIKTDNRYRTYTLPIAKAVGTVMNIDNPDDTVACIVRIRTNMPGRFCYLIGQTRGIPCYSSAIYLSGDEKVVRIPKNVFPTGITRFSLLNENYQPLNERLVYIDHHDQLNINLKPNKDIYAKRDSVALQVTVTDENNKPVKGSFSMAVTDDGQVKTDSIANENILTHMLLNAGVKGDIETPGHYLKKGATVFADLDILLLTQGWTGYDWEGVFSPVKPQLKYLPEPELQVVGKVQNAFGKVIAGTKVSLTSTRPHIQMDTLTDIRGWFSFQNFPVIDTPRFTIKAFNKRGKAFNVDLQLYRPTPLVLKESTRIIMPWNVNMDSTMVQNNKEIAMVEKNERYEQNGKMLKEVKILAKKVIKGSNNLNGPGNSDQILDEKEIQKVGRLNLYELLSKKIKGFTSSDGFKIYSQTLNFVFDGVYMGSRDLTSANTISYLLTSYMADDIIGIEVMNSMAYSARYNMKYRPGQVMHYTLSGNLNPAYVEITTRGGLGPFLDTSPGVEYYSTMPVLWPQKKIYNPKYKLKIDHPVFIDHRSTLFWEPNVATDTDGKANISFYTSDMTGSYTIITEGCDMKGKIGSAIQTIKIK